MDVLRYRRRQPAETVLYQVMQEHLETFLARTEAGAAGPGLPRHVRRELARFLDCGFLARGFCRVVCGTCSSRGSP